MRMVLDCSVTMAWCFEDENDDYSETVLDAVTSGEALVPSLWAYEVINVLAVAKRRGRLSEADGMRFLRLLSRLPVSVAAPPSGAERAAVLAIAHQHQLTGYDAAYLELALREGVPVATRDRGLRAACNAAGVSDVSLQPAAAR